MINNYLLVDYGNSYIKAAIYDGNQEKIIETRQVPSGQSVRSLFKLFRYLGDRHPDKIIVSASAGSNVVEPFYNEAKSLLNASIHIIGKPDFKDVLDLSNIAKDVFVGPDIYSCTYKATKQFKKPALVVSLGTAYFAVVVKDKKIESCYLLPSISKGMDQIAKLTTIPTDYIPEMYDKDRGRNTISSFAAGANLCIEGFIDNVVKTNNIDPKNVIITGGDCFRYKNISKKYTYVKNYVLEGLADLVKEKKW